ncbi:hypothetical protein CC86DRAFT_411153 [Ophiobolus disseminans]|uniref:RRM domain-containing protein n=1 Tax=Ophiobolus disseminans TaxID=1469910 RepID=A0A6A6ZM99_9PLEO|nr:hypothetical protein CC86DRAFT_411153 [Ophiobolus disseminans]
MTSTENMMAKMGHEQEENLGENAEGIMDAIQDAGNTGLTGLSSDDTTSNVPGQVNAWTVNREPATHDFKSQFIEIGLLPHNSEPKFVRGLFAYEEGVEDVYTPTNNGGGKAWVTFGTTEQAAVAAQNFDDHYIGFDSLLISAEEFEKIDFDLISYSDFRNQPKAEPTCTVKITNLPPSAPIKNIVQMIKAIGLDEKFDAEKNRVDNVEGVEIISSEGVLVHFAREHDAGLFQDCYNGLYWQNDTLRVEFRPDSEMEELVQMAVSKDSMEPFVGNIRNLTAAEVRGAGLPNTMVDVQLNAGGFAFVSLDAAAAVKLVDKYEDGFSTRTNHKTYFTPPQDREAADAFEAVEAKFDDGKQTVPPRGKAATASHPLTIHPPSKSRAFVPQDLAQEWGMKMRNFTPVQKQQEHPTIRKLHVARWGNVAPRPEVQNVAALTTPRPDAQNVAPLITRTATMSLAPQFVRVTINNLPLATGTQDIRNFFTDFTLCGAELEIKRGYAYVWLESETEAKRAVETLDKGVVRGQIVTVKL